MLMGAAMPDTRLTARLNPYMRCGTTWAPLLSGFGLGITLLTEMWLNHVSGHFPLSTIQKLRLCDTKKMLATGS
jgi:hypothetical protein